MFFDRLAVETLSEAVPLAPNLTCLDPLGNENVTLPVGVQTSGAAA